jgi:cryptochrome
MSSSSAFFTSYFRVYSPIAFGKKWDPKGDYVKKYLPQLSKFPKEYIYEPWKAPLNVQQKAGCIIGKDYPKPIVEHDQVMKVNMANMKKAYERGQKGIPTSESFVGAMAKNFLKKRPGEESNPKQAKK